MSIVIGVDFGTASVRACVYALGRGARGSATAPYRVRSSRADPLLATQTHAEHMLALEHAVRGAVSDARIDSASVQAIAIDTTGSTVIALDKNLEPLGPYYLWCDHRAWREAQAITERAKEVGLPHIEWCGGTYSSEWGWAKVLHWLRNSPRQRSRFATAAEHCDYIAGVLCGAKTVDALPRSICAAGHKWLWHADLGGFPSDEFFTSIDPLLAGVRDRIAGMFATSDRIAGTLSREWAARLGLKEGIPIPVGSLDAHWDAIGSGCRIGDVVNVLGTSSCIMAVAKKSSPIPGIPGVVNGSIDPTLWGIEAGLSAVGSLFDAIAKRARQSLPQLTQAIAKHRPAQTGIVRIPWDHGDRCLHANPLLRGVTIGTRLDHTAADELFAAIEGVAMQTRIVLQRMTEYGVPIKRIIHGGGIPQRNAVLNQVFANVIGKPIRVPAEDVTGRGSAMFAALACGAFKSINEAQQVMPLRYNEFEPQTEAIEIYEEVFERFQKLYFTLPEIASDAG